MSRWLRESFMLPIVIGTALLSSGCGEHAPEVQASSPMPGDEGAPPPLATDAVATEAGNANPGDASSTPSIKQVMTKLCKGPGSLTPTIGKALEGDPIAWESIQSQTKEFEQFALALGKNEPPQGDKESWTKRTTEYAGWATDLNKAALAKDHDAAMEAHAKLASSCKACHSVHRPMRGPGGGRPGFGPPSGPGGPGEPGGGPGFGPPPGGNAPPPQ